MQHDISGDIEELVELIGEAGPVDARFEARAGAHRQAGGHHFELLRDLFGCARRGAFAHQRRHERRETGLVGRIVIAARAGNEDLERELRQPVIFEHHQVQPVRQVGFNRFRQLDLQDLVRDRHFALLDDALRGRRLHLRRRLRRHRYRGECEGDRDDRG